MIYLHWKDLRCRWALLLSGCDTNDASKQLSLCYWGLQVCFRILQGLLWLLVWEDWSRCRCAHFRSLWLTTAAGSHTEWPQLPSQPSVSQWCLEMERMNGQVIFRKETFAKNPASPFLGKGRGREGAAGQAEVVWCCHARPIAFSPGENPDVRGPAVPGLESDCVWGQQGMRNNGLACLQLTAVQTALTTAASPRSSLGENVWPGLCKPFSHSPGVHRAQTPLGPAQPHIAQVVVTLLCRCFSQPEKDTVVLNIMKHLDAFPFPSFLPTLQQGFRTELQSDKSTPPTQPSLSTWLRCENLVCHRMPSFCLFVLFKEWYSWGWFSPLYLTQEFSLHFLWLQEFIHKVKENKRKK